MNTTTSSTELNYVVLNCFDKRKQYVFLSKSSHCLFFNSQLEQSVRSNDFKTYYFTRIKLRVITSEKEFFQSYHGNERVQIINQFICLIFNSLSFSVKSSAHTHWLDEIRKSRRNFKLRLYCGSAKIFQKVKAASVYGHEMDVSNFMESSLD